MAKFQIAFSISELHCIGILHPFKKINDNIKRIHDQQKKCRETIIFASYIALRFRAC